MRLWLKKILHEGSGSNRASTFLCKLSGDGGIEADLDEPEALMQGVDQEDGCYTMLFYTSAICSWKSGTTGTAPPLGDVEMNCRTLTLTRGITEVQIQLSHHVEKNSVRISYSC